MLSSLVVVLDPDQMADDKNIEIDGMPDSFERELLPAFGRDFRIHLASGSPMNGG